MNKMFRLLTVLVCLTFAFGLLSVSSQTAQADAATLYVDAAGACGGNTPCYTHPQDAVNAANPGDTILVYPGTYDSRYSQCPWQPNCSLSDVWAPAVIVYKDGLMLKSVEGPANTIIQATHAAWSNAGPVERSTNNGVKGVGGWAPNVITIIASNVTIDGFTFHRPKTCSSTNDCFNNTAGVFIGSKGSGYSDFLGRANNNTVKNNVFSDVWHAVYIWHSSGDVITNNTIAALGTTGHWAAISSYDGWDDAASTLQPQSINLTITNNTLADKGIALGAWAPATWTSNAGSKVCANTATQVGVSYSHGPVTVAGTGSFWEQDTDKVVHVTGITNGAPSRTIDASIQFDATVQYEGSGDGNGLPVILSVDGVDQDTVQTVAGGTATFTYTPLARGNYSITVKYTDCGEFSDTKTTNFNTAPVAQDQSVTTHQKTAKDITLAATDADNDPLTYSIVDGPTHGTLSGTPPGVTYTPTGDYIGPDSFTFKANDGLTDGSVATVSIDVTLLSLNGHYYKLVDAPYITWEDANTAADAAGSYAGCSYSHLVTITSDAEQQAISAFFGSAMDRKWLGGHQDPWYKEQAPSSDWHWVTNEPWGYTHWYSGEPNDYGGGPEQYLQNWDQNGWNDTGNDGAGNPSYGYLVEYECNHPPVAQAQSVTMDQDTTKAITLVATDADNDPVTYSIVASPTHGALSGTAPDVIYTPTAGYSGSDSFTFKANDGEYDSNTATVSITVNFVAKPALTLTKSANPTTYSYPGQVIVYSFTAKNTGNVALSGPFTISDDKLGSFQCGTAASLAVNATVNCTKTYTIQAGDLNATSITNTAAVAGAYNSAAVTSESTTATVYRAASTARIVPSGVTCAQFKAGAYTDVTDAYYQLKSGKISSVSPGIIEYYTTVTAPATTFQVVVQQTYPTGWRPLGIQSPIGQMYDANCKAVSVSGSVSGSTITFKVKNAQINATYYFLIKYAPSGVVGLKPPTSTASYLIKTTVGTTEILTSWDGITIRPK
jgi:parallel beta-helix repeat protein